MDQNSTLTVAQPSDASLSTSAAGTIVADNTAVFGSRLPSARRCLFLAVFVVVWTVLNMALVDCAFQWAGYKQPYQITMVFARTF